MYVKQEKKQVVHPLRTIIYSPTNKHKNQHQLYETKHPRLMKKKSPKTPFSKKKKKSHTGALISTSCSTREKCFHTQHSLKFPYKLLRNFRHSKKKNKIVLVERRRKKKSHEKISHARAH